MGDEPPDLGPVRIGSGKPGGGTDDGQLLDRNPDVAESIGQVGAHDRVAGRLRRQDPFEGAEESVLVDAVPGAEVGHREGMDDGRGPRGPGRQPTEDTGLGLVGDDECVLTLRDGPSEVQEGDGVPPRMHGSPQARFQGHPHPGELTAGEVDVRVTADDDVVLVLGQGGHHVAQPALGAALGETGAHVEDPPGRSSDTVASLHHGRGDTVVQRRHGRRAVVAERGHRTGGAVAVQCRHCRGAVEPGTDVLHRASPGSGRSTHRTVRRMMSMSPASVRFSAYSTSRSMRCR